MDLSSLELKRYTYAPYKSTNPPRRMLHDGKFPWWLEVGADQIAVAEFACESGVYYQAIPGYPDDDARFAATAPKFDTWQEAVTWVLIAGHTMYGEQTP